MILHNTQLCRLPDAIPMDIRACQMFVRLAETQHFGQTAKQSNLSPSAVSRQLQRIEEAIGETLVERDNRHVELTNAGKRFLVYARVVLDQWQQLRVELNQDRSSLRGEVSVFGSVTASYSILTQILPQIRTQFPCIDVKLRTGDQAAGVARVLAGSEDSAIIERPYKLPARLVFVPLSTTPLMFVGPRTPSALSHMLDQHLASGTEPAWHRTPMVLAESGLARERLLQRLRILQQPPDIYAQVAGHEAVVSMVSLGFSVAVVPELVIQHSHKQDIVRVLPWLDDLQPFELSLALRRERQRDVLILAFNETAVSAYPQMDAQ